MSSTTIAASLPQAGEVQARIYRAPEPITDILGRSVFLSGSVEPGGGERWHLEMIRRLEHLPVTIFDPWRDDWDNTWIQRKHDERFATQTRWELENLRRADIIAVYFAPRSEASVSLLEFGLSAEAKTVVVCCPDGFHRKGNIEILCEEEIQLVDTFGEFVLAVIEKLTTS
ncbi:hypothetical protein OH76DRAFT_1557250 [Lentinus brumalis]|uniref:Nucleoside 2-deoxyribosyltransferase n=1 Tax=Lentinus brumalis TaxID=2498619 RepID=A0A371D6J0_9APHY|nr:hypothetical protein OH76DRAFT_1557250 [Polyporus brumalis]